VREEHAIGKKNVPQKAFAGKTRHNDTAGVCLFWIGVVKPHRGVPM
jgi:hypothetical protein